MIISIVEVFHNLTFRIYVYAFYMSIFNKESSLSIFIEGNLGQFWNNYKYNCTLCLVIDVKLQNQISVSENMHSEFYYTVAFSK